MAINIKDPATDAIARQLAAATGESLTDAVRTSIEERWDRIRRQNLRSSRSERLQGYLDRARALPKLDERSLEELLYDEDGLPK